VFLFSGQVAGVVKQSPPPRRGPRFERRREEARPRKITGGGESERKKNRDEEGRGSRGSRLASASDILMEHVEENVEDYRVLLARVRKRACAWTLEGRRASRVV